MPAENTCRRCGAQQPEDGPAGLCPGCLLRLSLDAARGRRRRGRGRAPVGRRVVPPRLGLLGEHAGTAGRSRASGVLTDLDRAIGPVPRVLLRDGTGRDVEAGPARAPRRCPVPLGRPGPLPALRRDRPRRHGRRPDGPRRRPRPRPGRQGPPGGAPRRPRGRPPVRRGGADRRPAPAPGDRAGPRAGPAPRPAALHRHEAGPGPDPGRAAGGPPGPGRRPAAVPRRSSSRSARRWPTPTPGA